MGRFRVSSLSDWKRTVTSTFSSTPNSSSPSPTADPVLSYLQQNDNEKSPQHVPSPTDDSPVNSLRRAEGPGSRPASAFFPQQTSLIDGIPDAVPELEPIFTFLNNQANKLYQEGYFLKLNDLDTSGRPCADRQWVECFAQLTGTVLSLWDAAALDAAGQTGEVAPTFINIADATIKMIETLPTRDGETQPLQNVLSISTAGKNRYLLLFKTTHSLTKWTASIRLSMFENTLLQESYTGALIAGKGKGLNNIRAILERSRFKYEDWVRVRFGPGTPWKRCWCVITPPDEKEIQKIQKSQKKKSAYDRSSPIVKGDVKFYETKKTKKVQPVATITDAYSAFAIYPQSRPLIDQSTLVKLEGQITIHSQQQSIEGFVFVLPELHPAVSGFEIMLRWLMPVYDTFSLYGRPTRLAADIRSSKSLMFALPKRRRSGYLDILDVAGLIHTQGSQNWSEQEWRKQLKDATSKRMSSNTNSRESSIAGSKRVNRDSAPARNGTALRFSTAAAGPSNKLENNHSTDAVFVSTPNEKSEFVDDPAAEKTHSRANSENPTIGYGNSRGQATPPSPDSYGNGLIEEVEERAPTPPLHSSVRYDGNRDSKGHETGSSSDSDNNNQFYSVSEEPPLAHTLSVSPPPDPVAIPPEFNHSPGGMPPTRPQPSPELRSAGYRMSNGTLDQLVDMNKMAAAGAATAWNERLPVRPAPQNQTGKADDGGSREVDNAGGNIPVQGAAAAVAGNPRHNHPNNTSGGVVPDASIVDPSTVAASHVSNERRPQRPPSLDIQKATARKPLPHENQNYYGNPSPSTPSSLGSLRNAIDMDAMDQIVARVPSPQHKGAKVVRRETIPDEESSYDKSSVASPDYASSHHSLVSNRSSTSIQIPRMGVKKMVGSTEPEQTDLVIGDARYQAPKTSAQPNPDIPLVDFGPTESYNPTTRRPSTSDTLKLLSHNRNPSDVTLGHNERRASPGKINPDGRRSSTPSREEHRRSLMWQPGMAMGGRSSPGPRITPEQFVQQRAEAHRYSPVPVHQRNTSGATNLTRPISGDWANFNRRQSMATNLPPRPHSRGASVMLNQGDFSTQLSAREQEHVARATGSPFFNMSSETSRPASQVLNSGLVSAIDARERERRAMKEGVSGQMVQQAIAQRQYQGQGLHQPSNSMQYPSPGPMTPQHHSPYHQYSPSMNGSNYGGYFPQQQHQRSQSREWANGNINDQQAWSNQNPQQLRQQQVSPPPAYRPNPYFQQYGNQGS